MDSTKKLTVTGEELMDLADQIRTHKDRIIIEHYGDRFDIAEVRALGARTDDPGLIVTIR